MSRAFLVIFLVCSFGCALPGSGWSQGRPRLADRATDAHRFAAEIQAIAKLYQQQQYEEVIKQAGPLAERVKRQVGEENSDYVNLLGFIGQSYLVAGLPEQAEPIFRQALTIEERMAGPDGPVVATVLTLLGETYFELDRYADAERQFKRLLQLRQQAKPVDDTKVAEALKLLGDLYRKANRLNDAEQVLNDALGIYKKDGDIESAIGTIEYLVETYQREGRFEEALNLENEALAMATKSFGPQSVRAAEALCNISFIYNKEGRYVEGMNAAEQALKIKEQARGPDDPEVVCPLLNLAVSYKALGRYSDAERCSGGRYRSASAPLARIIPKLRRWWGISPICFGNKRGLATPRSCIASCSLSRKALEIGISSA